MRLTTLTGKLKSKQSVRKPILYAQNERLFKNDQHEIYQSRIKKVLSLKMSSYITARKNEVYPS